jgi:hypothetical protein
VVVRVSGGPWRAPTPPIVPPAPRLPERPAAPPPRPEAVGLFGAAVVVLLAFVGLGVVVLLYLCGVHLGWWP